MSRWLLLVTGVFYLMLAVCIYMLPDLGPLPTTPPYEVIAYSHWTRGILTVALLLAGALTVLSAGFYRWPVRQLPRLRVLAVGLRAGSMSMLEMLSILFWLAKPSSNVLSVVVFGYLVGLAFLTMPLPYPAPIEAVLQAGAPGERDAG